jgi:Flp pilus assembly pilin Flp
MQDIALRFAATCVAVAQVAGTRVADRIRADRIRADRIRDRGDQGQASAEYVGILVFVALLVVAIIALNTNIADKFRAVAEGAFDKIQDALG